MRFRIDYDKRPHQEDFQSDITTKFLALFGGFGSGKSHSIVMKAFDLSRRNKGIRGGCVVPSLPEFKRDLLPMFEEILDASGIPYRYHKTDKYFVFPWSSGKMDIATAERRIRGPNWGWAVINEFTLLSHQSFKETIGRVRVKRAPIRQIACSGTPEGTANWDYEVFIENPMKGSRSIHADTRDNLANLADDYVEQLESSYDPIMLDAYLRGLHVNMNGARFYYAYDPKKNDDKTIDQLEGAEVHVSLDYNVQPMIATLWNVVELRNKFGVPLVNHDGSPMIRAYAFDTIEIPDGADTNKMCDAFDAYGLHPATTTIYPDPAGKHRATQGPPDNVTLKNRGWAKIRVKLAAPQFRRRQLGMNNLLAKEAIKLNPVKCKPLKGDFEKVEQDKATYEKLKNNPKLTHASDGADYMFDILCPLSGQKPQTRSIKYR